jgi:hypothetical protein
LDFRHLFIILLAIQKDLIFTSHAVERVHGVEGGMEGGVTANEPRCELHHDTWDSSQVSNEVHEVVDDPRVRQLVNFHPYVHLGYHIFGACWSGLECVGVELKIVEKYVLLVLQQ